MYVQYFVKVLQLKVSHLDKLILENYTFFFHRTIFCVFYNFIFILKMNY